MFTTRGEHIEGVQVEALVDAEAGRAQLGEAVTQRRYRLVVCIGVFQWIPPSGCRISRAIEASGVD